MKDTGRRESNLPRLDSTGSVGVRARRAERVREQILRAGLKVFSEKGFNGATMDDIALELEATKGLLYYHFKTKEEILSAILKQSPVIAEIEAGIRALDATVPFPNAIRAAVHGALAVLEEHRDFIRFLHIQAILSSKEAEVVYNEVIGRFVDLAVEGIERARSAGMVRPDVNPRHWATMMVSLITSLFLQGQIFGKHHDPEPGYLDFMIDNLVAMIAANPDPASN
jgi:TetR/AcrR family transcriptional regulator